VCTRTNLRMIAILKNVHIKVNFNNKRGRQNV